MSISKKAGSSCSVPAVCRSVLVVAALIGAAACGSDDDASPAATNAAPSTEAVDTTATESTTVGTGATESAVTESTAAGSTAVQSTADCGRSLTAATIAGDSGSQGYLADEGGFYEQHGLDVDVQIVAGVPELAAAVQSGSAQFALTAPSSIASAAASGIPFRVVGAGALYTSEVPGTHMMVGTDSGIETYADLAGRTVAINALNSAIHFAALAAIEDAGVNVDDVEFVVLNFPAVGQAIESGQVDAGVAVSPFYKQIELEGIGRSIGSPYDAVNDEQEFLNTVWFSTEDFIESNPGCVELFRAAIVDTSEWANDVANLEERKAILQEYAGLTDEAIANLTPLVFGTEATPELLQPQFDVMTRFGGLEERVDAASLINLG